MADYEQTWLSLSGICDRLRLTPKQVRTLVRKGCLAYLDARGATERRYLDPTPEYAEQLRIGAIIHQKLFPVSEGLSEKGLLTSSECAELLGIKWKNMDNYLRQHRIDPTVRVSKMKFLYSPSVVREIMLKRQKKTLSRQQAPLLLTEMIELFRARLADELSLIPTDAEFAADEKLQRKLEKIVTESQKADFAGKVKLARKILQILESAKAPATSPTSSSMQGSPRR